MQLTDGDQIRNLLGSYCRLIDAGDFAGVGALMAQARLCTEDGTVVATGADEAAALYTGMVRRHDDGTPRTQHLVLNTVLEEDGSESTDSPGDTAIARSTYVVLQATDGVPLQPIVTGGYVDTFGLGKDGDWHFTERRFSIRLVGDTSQHMLGGTL